jgi:hypothetical protein
MGHGTIILPLLPLCLWNLLTRLRVSSKFGPAREPLSREGRRQ